MVPSGKLLRGAYERIFNNFLGDSYFGQGQNVMDPTKLMRSYIWEIRIRRL